MIRSQVYTLFPKQLCSLSLFALGGETSIEGDRATDEEEGI